MNYVEEHRFPAAYLSQLPVDKEVLLCRICAQIATRFPWRTVCGGVQLGRSTAAGGAQSAEKI